MSSAPEADSVLMKSLAIVGLSAVLLGCAVGWTNGTILAHSVDAAAVWSLPVLALGAALIALSSTASFKPLTSALGITAIALAIQLTIAVLVEGCGGRDDCMSAIVQTLVWPFIILYIVVAVPFCVLSWRLMRGRRRH